MNASDAAMAEVASWTYLPARMFAIGAPCAFILFGPKEWVDVLLRSPNAPGVLNPWVGLVFLYMASFFTVHVLKKIVWWLTWPFRWLRRAVNRNEDGTY